ncbi:Uncharacterised protein [Mycobacteroides abscessus subsp. bolletii]|nr:Uncharacterised protein [Mycobacteroides abscessus subsp. bolletii]
MVLEFILYLSEFFNVRNISISSQGLRFHIFLKIHKPLPTTGLPIIKSHDSPNDPIFPCRHKLRPRIFDEFVQKLAQIVPSRFELALRHV